MPKSPYKTLPQLSGTLAQSGPWQSIFVRGGHRIYPMPAGCGSANSGTLTTLATNGTGDFIAGDYLLACSASYYGDTPIYVPDMGRITRVVLDPSATTSDALDVSPALTVRSDDWFCNLGADLASSPTITPNLDGSRITLYADAVGNSTLPNPYVITGVGGTFRCWLSASTEVIDLLVTDGSGRPVLLIPGYRVSPALVSGDGGVILANLYATSGDGTVSNPYIGWEGCVQAVVDSIGGRDSIAPHARLHFPAGVYKTTKNGVFSDYTINTAAAKALHGLQVTGDGHYNSLLLLDDASLSSQSWFFDNYEGSVHTPGLLFSNFIDLGFVGSLSDTTITKASGFRVMWDVASAEQALRFTRCRFDHLYDGFSLLGGNNNSENQWLQCRIYNIFGTVLYLDNYQAVNNEFHGTDIERVRGHVIKLGPNGGGSVKVFGGSWIMEDIPAAGHVVYGPQLVPHPAPIYFYGTRFELRAAASKLVCGTVTQSLPDVTFRDCEVWYPGLTNPKSIAIVPPYSFVIFDGCKITSATATLFVETNGTVNTGRKGTIGFVRCTIPMSLMDNVIYTGADSQYAGHVYARDCLASESGYSTEGVAMDFDFWQTTGYVDRMTPLKRAVLKPLNLPWPADTNNDGVTEGELVLLLPPNATIRNIKIFYPGGQGTAAMFQLKVGNDDKTVTYGTSTLAAQTSAHTINLTDINILTGTGTAASRRVRLWSNTGVLHGYAYLGSAIVEYD